MSARAAVADSWAVLGAIRGEGEAARTMRRLLQRARAGNLRLLLNLVNLGEIYYRLIQITGQSAADRKSTRLNSSHGYISYAVFCLKKKKRDLHLNPGCDLHDLRLQR